MDQMEINAHIGRWMAQRDALNDSIYNMVGELRRMGATWTQLGNALGTSPQAAQQRFGTSAYGPLHTVRDEPAL